MTWLTPFGMPHASHGTTAELAALRLATQNLLELHGPGPVVIWKDSRRALWQLEDEDSASPFVQEILCFCSSLEDAN